MDEKDEKSKARTTQKKNKTYFPLYRTKFFVTKLAAKYLQALLYYY